MTPKINDLSNQWNLKPFLRGVAKSCLIFYRVVIFSFLYFILIITLNELLTHA